MTINELYSKIVAKSKKDKKFKKNLIDNPKEAIKEEYGVTFADNVQISVYQSTPDHMHYVIPLA